MNVLITGANGFLGRNLIDRLSSIPEITVYPYHHLDGQQQLEEYCRKSDFVFHFAAVSRPDRTEDFTKVNVDFLETLLDSLKKVGNKCPVLLSSSTQAELKGRFAGSLYGLSKLKAEELLLSYGEINGVQVMYYRLPHLFGKWGAPNYNNVVHTLLYNYAHGLSVKIDDPNVMLELMWEEDLLDDMISIMQSVEHKCGILDNPITYNCSLGQLNEIIKGFSLKRQPLGDFQFKLYESYTVYRS